MSTAIDFYFDFSSPYGYFASTRIDALAAQYGREVRWHPILLGAVFKLTGSAPLPTVPLKGEYALYDFARTARFHDIAYKQPNVLPISSQAAARATLWVRATRGEAASHEFVRAVYRAYYAEGVDITDQEQLARVTAAAGFNAAEMIEAINSPAIKDQLKEEVAAAIDNKVFGSPFVIVDGEPFWGFDRFDQLETFLKNGKI